jgi:hypothetical protein
MRNVLCLALLVPILALAAGSTETVVAPVPGMARGTPTPGSAQALVPARALVGTMDTVGGTIYDWVANGPTYRFVANSSTYGVHVTWMYSNDTMGTQADRNMRYNFYDFASRTWNWIDPDFMLSGVNTFTERSGFGSLGANPSSGVAVISCHSGSAPLRPVVARDAAAGAGIFEYCDGTPTLDNYLWPPIDVDTTGGVQLFGLDDPGRQNIWYSRAATWCNWEQAVQVTQTPPTFPTQQIATSKVSDKICLSWVKADAYPYVGFYRLSSDRGLNWDNEIDIGYPPAYSSSPDTLCSYYITSMNPYYDRTDRLHIIVNTMPIITDTVFAWPNEIWHWCADNNPQWSKVGRAEGDIHATYAPGTNALLACRPQLGEDSHGNLYAVWEQFDTTNVEPQTNLLRSDVWLNGSNDNGVTWTPAVKIAAAGTNSLRFPSITDMAISGGTDSDTLGILYQADQVAGFRAGSSPIGPWSNNPMIFHKVPADSIIPLGVAERPSTPPTRFAVSASPSPASGRTVISYAVPQSGDVSLVVYDAVGRPVQTLVSGRREAGRYSATWDAGKVATGVYFYTLTSGKTSVTRKLILAD